jgi:tRNA(Ile)-lysidine synthase
VIPGIQEIEPAIHRHIFRTVAIIQQEYDYFSQLAKEILLDCLILDKVLPAKILTDYHLAVQRHIVREYVRLLKGNLLNIDFEHIEAVRTLHAKTGGLAIPGIQLTFHKGFIFPREFSIPGYDYRVDSAGTIEIEEIGKTIAVEKAGSFQKPANNNEIIVPFQAVKFPLILRSPLREDKYVKINTTINQKVFEMIRASGLPSELRNLCPVLLNGDGEIIWVIGSPVADAFKVKDRKKGEFLVIK